MAKENKKAGDYLLFIIEGHGYPGETMEEIFVGRFTSIDDMKKGVEPYLKTYFDKDINFGALKLYYYNLRDNTWNSGKINVPKPMIEFN